MDPDLGGPKTWDPDLDPQHWFHTICVGVLVVLANKQDIEGAMSVTEVHGALGLDKLKNRTFQIFKVMTCHEHSPLVARSYEDFPNTGSF
jgi:hypothetical protein